MHARWHSSESAFTAAGDAAPRRHYRYRRRFDDAANPVCLRKVDGIVDRRHTGLVSKFLSVDSRSWVSLEIGTIVAGFVALRFVRFPFMTLPIVFSLWFFSMDIVGLCTHGHAYEWHTLQASAACYGIVMIALAMYIDKRVREDFGFWMYLYGGFALNAAASRLWEGADERLIFVFALFALCELCLSIIVQRRGFDGNGNVRRLHLYRSSRIHRISRFADFPVRIVVVGLSIIFVAVYYQKTRNANPRNVTLRAASALTA